MLCSVQFVWGTVWVQALEDWNYGLTSESTCLGSPPVLSPVHTIGYLMESNPMDFFVGYPMKLTFISLAYTPSVKNLTVPLSRRKEHLACVFVYTVYL